MEPADMAGLLDVLAEQRDVLRGVSDEVWGHPEENFQEVLTSALAALDFTVTPNFIHPTGFKAEVQIGSTGSEKCVHVCCISEYDALPGIGHACGHNLIAVCGVMVGLLLKRCLESLDREVPGSVLPVKVTVLGTPAEEGGGGKVKMIEEGFFRDVDLAVMAHPSPYNIVKCSFLAIQDLRITFRGSAAHAAMAPWKGVNALDAAVTCYSSISHLRQQFKPDWRVHGVFTKGGDKPNIIPAEAELLYYIRCLDQADMPGLVERVRECARAAALATGCSVQLTPEMLPYKSVVTDAELAPVCERFMEDVGLPIGADPGVLGSTDMGNVSHEVRSLHPMYRIGNAVNHTPEFTQLAGSDFAYQQTEKMAVALASTLLHFVKSRSA